MSQSQCNRVELSLIKGKRKSRSGAGSEERRGVTRRIDEREEGKESVTCGPSTAPMLPKHITKLIPNPANAGFSTASIVIHV